MEMLVILYIVIAFLEQLQNTVCHVSKIQIFCYSKLFDKPTVYTDGSRYCYNSPVLVFRRWDRVATVAKIHVTVADYATIYIKPLRTI